MASSSLFNRVIVASKAPFSLEAGIILSSIVIKIVGDR
jgi:hypothetical protein